MNIIHFPLKKKSNLTLDSENRKNLARYERKKAALLINKRQRFPAEYITKGMA